VGVIIPLFKKHTQEIPDPCLTAEEKLRLKLIYNSIEALKREEKVVEAEISEKCCKEIERLNLIDKKLRELEYEAQSLATNNPIRPYCER
jgi:hypothetical protein